MLAETRADFFVRQRLTTFDLRQALLDFAHEPIVVVDQTLDRTTLAKAGGRLKLLNVGKRNHDLLSITKLVSVFDTFDSEREAVESYAATTPA